MTAEKRLISILRKAYSGERAAALAYAGHWRSVRCEADRKRIRDIEEEELKHRQQLGEMLATLGHQPDPELETRATRIGRTIGALCYVIGWFAPMYGAGRLESSNIREYENAARFACESDHPELVDCLLTMAEVEWEHERYFRTHAQSHWLARLIPVWPAPPQKGNIRAGFPTDGSQLVLAES